MTMSHKCANVMRENVSIVYCGMLLLGADLTGGSRIERVGVISTRWLLFLESVHIKRGTQDSAHVSLRG